MKRFHLLLVLIITPSFLFSQNITVKSFRQLQNDMDARVTFSKPDQNGDKCAIIKVVSAESELTWDGDMLGIVSVEKKTGEYWLYIPHDAKRLTIKHDKFGLLRDYEYPVPILEATVYELILGTPSIDPEPKDIVNQYLTINAEPKGAKIYINNNLESTDSLKKLLIPGNYQYRVTAQFYHPDSGKVFVTPDHGESLNISLKPNHGFISLSSFPKQKAKVYIDGGSTNLVTPCLTDKLISGEHTISISKKFHRSSTQKVTITDGNTEEVKITLQSDWTFVRNYFKSHRFSINLGYYNTTFSNSFFKENILNGNIKRGIGYAATLNFNLFPLIFDMTYFSARFTVNNIEAFKPNSMIIHRGGEVSVNIIPYPIGVVVFPYLGAGYQYSQLYTSSLSSEGTGSDNTSLPIIKGGVKIRISKLLVFGEYKKGIDFNGSGYASGQIFSGIGWVF
ncbi:MAG: PEGA domain-containing protein [Bacteroidales bacterium]|nr:PEGA domain-containing protein [Bacteroidales bacterium]